MRLIRTLIALALVVCLTSTTRAADNANGAKKGKHLIHGQVVSVQMDANNKGAATITVLVHHHKKGATNTAPVEKTFKVSAGTKFELVQGKKGAVQQNAADVTTMQKGDHVLISHSGTDATDVKIVRKGKGAKKNT
jgi:hypothetical protein